MPYLVCALVGAIAGVINVLAGGGSFLTLPVLLFLGLPAAVANGTNRVGVMTQSLGAVWGFHRHGKLDWGWAFAVSVPAVIGAALGVWASLVIPDFAFRRILSVVMLAITLWTLFRKSSTPPVSGTPPRSPWHWSTMLAFFGVGVYGGFLQAGVGFLVLAATSAAGLDLVRGNAVKMLSVLLLTVLSLAVFAGTGNVDWPLGLALGAGNLGGAMIGVRLAVLKGHRWLERIVTITIVIFAILLWVTG
ncbi:MAG: sulfite exporter TauE/SafE family protein [Vicinamibacterales bacterium]